MTRPSFPTTARMSEAEQQRRLGEVYSILIEQAVRQREQQAAEATPPTGTETATTEAGHV